MPTNSAVREIFPPNRLTWASKYSRSKISRASRKGSDIRCSPPAPFGDNGTGENDLVGQHIGGHDLLGIAADQDHQTLDVVAELADIARANSCDWSTAMASSPMRRGGKPEATEMVCTK